MVKEIAAELRAKFDLNTRRSATRVTPGAPAPSVASGKVPAPVRVKLKRVNCNEAIPYPPGGETHEWWQRLKNAFGTPSSDFVEASLYQRKSTA